MDVRRLEGRWALVTGAASGIGRETALECARRGASLALCDLDEPGLEETAASARTLGREVLTRRVDVASAEEMAAFADAVHERTPGVDLLVNNAGVAIGGGMLVTSLEDWAWIRGVNLDGVVHGVHYFAPRMVERGAGHVVIVSSMAGYAAAEGLAAYNTTKFAVLGLAEALADELRPRGVGVTAICPGLIDTPITRNVRLRGTWDNETERARMVDGYRRRGYTPDRVAKAILSAVQRNRVVAPVSPEAWTFYYLKRLAPGVVRWLTARLGARARRERGEQI